MAKTQILIMTDSRGGGLEGIIVEDIRTRHPNLLDVIQITVQVIGGAKIENIVEKADKRFNVKIYDIIYLFVGVNNLTCKLFGKVFPVFENVPDLIDTITDAYTSLKMSLEKRSAKIVVCQTVGIEMDTYNSYQDEGFCYYHQQVINEAMPILAHTVNFINRADNVVGPWITNTVHDYVNHKLYNRYAKLQDGLHPSTALKK